jgi:hypothetical protein
LHTPRKNPLSKQDISNEEDLPWLVPDYDPTATVDLDYGTSIQVLLFAMKADFNSPYCHVASDNLLVVLDSGCSIAITPDIRDFINGTYLPQEHDIKGINSGINSSGIGEVNWKLLDINGKTVTYLSSRPSHPLLSPTPTTSGVTR